MKTCSMCQEQAKKSSRGVAHGDLVPIDEPRIFRGNNARGYEEQDYQCRSCNAKFTRSTNMNDLAWTLWLG
jgi:hypothetical protein